MLEKKLNTYDKAIKEFAKNLMPRYRTYEQMERRGDIPPGYAEKLIAETIEAQVYAIANVVARVKIAQYKKRHEEITPSK